MEELTTVKRLKEILEPLPDDTNILFTDGDVSPGKPYVFDIYTSVSEYLGNNITEEYHEEYIKELKEMDFKETDIIIHVEY